jgi:hypothetical protein
VKIECADRMLRDEDTLTVTEAWHSFTADGNSNVSFNFSVICQFEFKFEFLD